MFRQKFNQEHPEKDASDKQVFFDISSRDVIREFRAEDGSKITRREKVVERTLPDLAKLENRGVSCSLFTIENQQNAGVDLRVQNTIQMKPSLDDVAALNDNYDSVDLETFAFNFNSNNSQTSNSDENNTTNE